MSFRQSFCVKGCGTFPFDMLRYDYCYPASEEDSININGTEERVIKLCRRVDLKAIKPSHRWSSFGWKIELNSIETTK